MKNKLQTYFPIIRTRGEVLEELRENKELWKTFCGWKETCQQEYLDLCTGVKGIKLLYDTYFKAIMNPDTRPDRFNDFISEMLGQRVKVLKVLPNESARIAAESSLLVMDVVVQLEDGSIANVEVQKIGYLFPGERSACYSADLLLRQYKRAREELGATFSYKNIKRYTQSSCLKRVAVNSENFQQSCTCIDSDRQAIQAWRSIYYRSIRLYVLTFLITSSTIKIKR